MALLETNVVLRRIVNLYNLLGRNTSMLVCSTKEYFTISLREKCAVCYPEQRGGSQLKEKKTRAENLFLRESIAPFCLFPCTWFCFFWLDYSKNCISMSVICPLCPCWNTFSDLNKHCLFTLFPVCADMRLTISSFTLSFCVIFRYENQSACSLFGI